MCLLNDGFAKNVTKKTTEGLARGRRQKDCASPERLISIEGRGFLTAEGNFVNCYNLDK